jgi:nucleobase:cation symporter-1, NCS1 family
MSKKHRELSILPTKPGERTLTALDLALLWFGAAISIGEIWAGGLPALTVLGVGAGLAAIVLGRIVGNGLMAAMARIGADSGLPTMVLTRPAFGIRGSYIPAFFNVLQLVGWTGWMLFVGYLYLDTVASYLGLPGGGAFPAMRYIWIILLGVLCTWWAAGGHRFWKSIQLWSSIALFVLTLGMTAIVLTKYDISQFWSSTAGTPLGILAGADLVIAMSVSWLPLVADYSRFAVKGRAGAGGTFWGYFVGGVWMYAVGLLVATATGQDKPDLMVVNVMGGQGIAWAIAAIFLVLLSTVTTTFLDIYSSVISLQSLAPKLSVKQGNIAVGAIGTCVALMLDVFAYQPFLEAIGAIFLPAFTIVLADHYLLSRRKIYTAQLAQATGAYWYNGGYNWRALLAWVAGFLVYDTARGFTSINFFAALVGHEYHARACPCGASLPCIIATAMLYLLLAAVFGQGIRDKR